MRVLLVRLADVVVFGLFVVMGLQDPGGRAAAADRRAGGGRGRPRTATQGALAAVAEVVRGNEHLLRDPAPLIQIGELAESTAYLTVKPWVAVQDHSLVESDLRLAVLEALGRRGFRLAVPMREVRLIDAAR